MSEKFEKLLDYLVNEEMDKANELFHEIVVEKSRKIYEDLISEEIETEAKKHDDEEMDEAKEEEMDESAEEEMEESADEDMDEAKEEEMDEAHDEDMDEAAEELEDSYVMDGGAEEHDFEKGDATDELGAEVMAGDDEEGHDDDSAEDKAIFDIKNAIEELEAAFAELEKSQGDDGAADFGDDEGDDMGDEPKMGLPEGKRLTREYVEKVGHDWDSAKAKAQGKAAGADSGESMGAPAEGKSPISSGKGKPVTGADAKNIAQAGKGENQDGTKPHGKAGGLVKNAQEMKTGNGNVPGGHMGVKNLSKVAGGHGADKKGGAAGLVGAGTGDAPSLSGGNDKSPVGSKKL